MSWTWSESDAMCVMYPGRLGSTSESDKQLKVAPGPGEYPGSGSDLAWAGNPGRDGVDGLRSKSST